MMQKTIYKPTLEDFNTFSANLLSDTIKKTLDKSSNEIFIALSGGNTPISILKILKYKNIDWKRISFYMVDERCVLPNDISCNFNNIKKVFFNNISSKYFSMIEEGVSFEKASKNYQLLLDKNLPKSKLGVPVFDLILLGMGNDGHTASLFPETNALKEQFNFVVLNDVPQLKTQRITLSYPVLLASKEIIVLFKGEKKEQIVEEIYSNNGISYPIDKIVKEHSNFKWIIGVT